VPKAKILTKNEIKFADCSPNPKSRSSSKRKSRDHLDVGEKKGPGVASPDKKHRISDRHRIQKPASPSANRWEQWEQV